MTKLSASIGIIGGADGPTAIFVTGSDLTWMLAVALIIFAIGACVLFAIFRKRKTLRDPFQDEKKDDPEMP